MLSGSSQRIDHFVLNRPNHDFNIVWRVKWLHRIQIVFAIKFWKTLLGAHLCSEKIAFSQMTTMVISKMIYISQIFGNVSKCVSLGRIEIFCWKIAIKLCGFGDI
jgi:hypothetical protein